MGDPKKQRKKYSKPIKMWNVDRIKRDSSLVREYGLKNKKEIWKLNHILKNYQIQAKKLLASEGKQEMIEKKQLMNKLSSLGLINPSDDLNAILGLSIKDFLNRRLQSVIFNKKMARSLKQARQMVTHEHVSVSGSKITIPSYLVSIEEENFVQYSPDSPFKSENHPERFVETVEEIPDNINAVTKEKKDEKEKATTKENKDEKEKVTKEKSEKKEVTNSSKEKNEDVKPNE